MRAVRILPVRDEADVLEANLRWYGARGVETIAIDNGSTDGSVEVLREGEREGWVIHRASIPPRGFRTSWHEWAATLRLGQELIDAERPDAQLLTAADEFFEVGDGTSLMTAIAEDIALGYTVLEFKNMEFHMTDGDPDGSDVLRRLRWYSHRDVGMYRGLRWAPGIDLATHFGHRPLLPEKVEWRLSPRIYVSRHYPLRTREQLERKIRRMQPRPERPEAVVHYLRLLYGEHSARVPRDFLTRYEEDHRWVLEEKELPWRLRQTTEALSRAHLRVQELEAELHRG